MIEGTEIKKNRLRWKICAPLSHHPGRKKLLTQSVLAILGFVIHVGNIDKTSGSYVDYVAP